MKKKAVKGKKSPSSVRGARRGRSDAPAQGRRPVRSEREAKLPHGRQVVGIHAVKECLATSLAKPTMLWIKEGVATPEISEIVELAREKGVEVREKAPRALDAVAQQHQNLCLFAPPAPELDLELLSTSPSRLLVLDQLEDPHNLGALIRTAWLMGASGIIASEHRSVGLTPAAHKVASGGVEHVPLLFQSNFAPSFERLKAKGYWIFGLAAEGATSLYDQVFPEKVVIVVGAEESGVRKSTRGFCDELISIPQVSATASYNASVAGAIALGEVLRQHRAMA